MVLHFHYKTELVAFYSVFCQNYRDNDPTNSRQNILKIFYSFEGGRGNHLWSAPSVAGVAPQWPQKCINKLVLSTIKCNLNWTQIIYIICGRKSDQFRGKIWIKLPVFISRHQEDMAQRLMICRLLYSPENCNEIDTLNRRFFFLSVDGLLWLT